VEKTIHFNNLYESNRLKLNIPGNQEILLEKMSKEDRKEFPLFIKDVCSQEEYVKLSCEGIKKFYIK